MLGRFRAPTVPAWLQIKIVCAVGLTVINFSMNYAARTKPSAEDMEFNNLLVVGLSVCSANLFMLCSSKMMRQMTLPFDILLAGFVQALGGMLAKISAFKSGDALTGIAEKSSIYGCFFQFTVGALALGVEQFMPVPSRNE